MDSLDDQSNANHQRMLQLILLSENSLRNLFQKLWKSVYYNDFNSNSSSVLLSRMKRSTLFTAQKELLVAGDPNAWDVSLLCQVIRSFDEQLSNVEKETVQCIQRVRNKTNHSAQLTITDADFERMFKDLGDALVKSKFVDTDIIQSIKHPKLDTDTNLGFGNAKEANSTGLKLKEEGNLLFRKGKYEDALLLYGEALLIGGLFEPSLHASLYSNRSVTYLKLGRIHEAISEATSATKISPLNGIGYQRLASAFKEAGKHAQAVFNLEKAITLFETCDMTRATELKKILSEWKHAFDKQQRGDGVNLNYKPGGFRSDATKAQLKAMLGRNASIDSEATLISAYRSGLLDRILPGSSKVQAARDYSSKGRHDLATQELLQAAVETNSAEAMYNLAVYYMEGLGVAKDFSQSFHWAKKASECPVPEIPMIPLSQRAIGVSSGLFTVGNHYDKGLMVSQNFVLAIEYWEKAAELDHAGALNTLGTLYYHGIKGKPRNVEKALDYYQAAADLGETTAMINLALYYASVLDLRKALSWAATAKEHGDYSITHLEADWNEQLLTIKDYKMFEDFRSNPAVREVLDAIQDSRAQASLQRPDRGIPQNAEILEADLLKYPGMFLKRLVSIAKSLERLMEDFGRNGLSVPLVRGVAELIRRPDAQLVSQTPFIFAFGKMLKEWAGSQRALEKDLLVDVEVCYFASIAMEPKDFSWKIAELEKICGRYPDDNHLQYLLSCLLAFPGSTCDICRSLEISNRILARYHALPDADPIKMDLLYHVGVLHSLMSPPEPQYQFNVPDSIMSPLDRESTAGLLRAKEFLERFLGVGQAENHRKVSQACYILGTIHLNLNTNGVESTSPDEQLKSFVEMGDNGAMNLPEYLRELGSPQRKILQAICSASQMMTKTGPELTPMVGISQKFKRNTAHESILLKKLRRHFVESSTKRDGIKDKSPFVKLSTSTDPPLRSFLRTQDRNDQLLSPIYLQDVLGPRKDQVFFGRSLRVLVVTCYDTIVADQCIVEDEFRYPVLLSIYNGDSELRRSLIPGSVFLVRNPYGRVSKSGDMMIRVDKPSETIKNLPDEKLSLCWSCSREATKLSCCGACKKAMYCDATCQRTDWHGGGHKYQCRKIV